MCQATEGRLFSVEDRWHPPTTAERAQAKEHLAEIRKILDNITIREAEK